MLDILIVEDNKEIGSLLCDFLRKENYTVSVAKTGEKALELYETTPGLPVRYQLPEFTQTHVHSW